MQRLVYTLYLLFFHYYLQAQANELPNEIREGQTIKVELQYSSCYQSKPIFYCLIKKLNKEKIITTWFENEPSFIIKKNKEYFRKDKLNRTSADRYSDMVLEIKFMTQYKITLDSVYFNKDQDPYDFEYLPIRVKLVQLDSAIIEKIETRRMDDYIKFKTFYSNLSNDKYEDLNVCGEVIIAGTVTNYRYYLKDVDSRKFKLLADKSISGWCNAVFMDR